MVMWNVDGQLIVMMIHSYHVHSNCLRDCVFQHLYEIETVQYSKTRKKKKKLCIAHANVFASIYVLEASLASTHFFLLY